MKNIEENNKLIAEFMDFVEYVSHDNGGGSHFYWKSPVNFKVENRGNGNSFAVLKFHKSWDWLMPVVEKITEIIKEYGFDTPEGTKYEMVFDFDVTLSAFLNADRSNIYERCVEFIKWYNKQK